MIIEITRGGGGGGGGGGEKNDEGLSLHYICQMVWDAEWSLIGI